MYLKTYIKYISKDFFEIILKVSFVFYSLTFILTVFEELSFFKEMLKLVFYIQYF